MRKILIFLWLIVGMAVATLAQTLTLSVDDYDPKIITNSTQTSVVNIRSNIELTIVASGGPTYWVVDKYLEPFDENSFSITNPTNNTVEVQIPFYTYDEIILTVYFGSMENFKIIKFIKNDSPVLGLFAGQNVSDCSGASNSFDAADYSESYEYQWQRRDGSNWVPVVSTANYVALGRNLTVFVNNNTEGMRFRAIVKNLNCLGAIEETGEVVIEEAYPLPTATFLPDGKICAGDEIDLIVTPTGFGQLSVTMQNATDDLLTPNNINPVTGVVSGATATFRVAPAASTTYHFLIVDANGCRREY